MRTALSALKPWFAPIVPAPSSAYDPETSWVEVDPRGNPLVRHWKRPKRDRPWNTSPVSVLGKSLLSFLPLVVVPLVIGFMRGRVQEEKTCYRDPKTRMRVCEKVVFHYLFGQKVLIASGFYFLFFFILEQVLMSYNRLHPWMYISIYVAATIFPALLFPINPYMPWKYPTIIYAVIVWVVCTACVLQGIVVSRRLARGKRVTSQVDDDARLAEELFQEGEREERELAGGYRDEFESGASEENMGMDGDSSENLNVGNTVEGVDISNSIEAVEEQFIERHEGQE